MKGNNSFELNAATMIAALQLYFDKTFRDGESPIVTAIRPSPSPCEGRTFTVTVKERETSDANRS